MGATLLLWRSMRQMSGIQRLLTNPGHSTLMVTYKHADGKNQTTTASITWYSGRTTSGQASSHAGTIGIFRPGNIFKEMVYLGGGGHGDDLGTWIAENRQVGWVDMMMQNSSDEFRGNTFVNLLSHEVRAPNLQAEVPTLNDSDYCIGLFDMSIVAWWTEFAANNNTYNILYRSCAAVCGNALLAGGASLWKDPPSGIWTPESVYKYAKELGEKIRKQQQFFDQARTRLISEAAKLRTHIGDVWTSREFKQASSVSWARRYQSLQDIDLTLERYHRARNNGDHSASFRWQLELHYLAYVVLVVRKILNERPNTKRLAALAQLGKQCIDRIQSVKLDQRIAIDKDQFKTDLEKELERKLEARLELMADLGELRDTGELNGSPVPDTEARILAGTIKRRMESMLLEEEALTHQIMQL